MKKSIIYTKQCECGCGKIVKRKFAWGHNTRNKSHSNQSYLKGIETRRKNGWFKNLEEASKKHSESMMGKNKGKHIERFGAKKTKEIAIKKSASSKGKKHWNWQGGKSFEEYPQEFNNSLKEKIRKHDGYHCQECFRHQNELRTKSNKPYKLPVHHIDYNKNNNEEKNLISLCRPCHLQTNYKRQDWTHYFNGKI